MRICLDKESPDRTSQRIATLLALAILTYATGCEETETPPQRDPSEVRSWASQERFGDNFAPDRVVASVGGAEITVADVAICQAAQPILNPVECLEWLIDTEVVLLEADENDWSAPRVADARTAAMASAYLRDTIDRPLADETIADSEIDAFLSDPTRRLYVEAPELRRCSHLLIRTPDGPNDDARALAEQIFTETDWSTVTVNADLDRLRTDWADRASEIGLSLVVEKQFLVHNENDDPGAWPLITPVVQAFADGVFALEDPPAISPPVETQFGEHFILLERVYPATRLSDEDARALVRAELGQIGRIQSFQQLITSLLDQRRVAYSNAIEIFRASDEQLIQERSSEIRESLRSE